MKKLTWTDRAWLAMQKALIDGKISDTDSVIIACQLLLRDRRAK